MKMKSEMIQRIAVCVTAILLLSHSAVADSLHTQSFNLQPGWNSIFVQVQPEDNSPETVFAGMDVESVWTYSERHSSVDFIQDPNEPIWNRTEWLVYIPDEKPAAFQTSFFAVLPNRSYLVHLGGSTAAALNITGRPIHQPKEWAPNAYNLTGFNIDPNAAPTFYDFFKYSPAHIQSSTGLLQTAYRLNAGGQWELVTGGDLIEAGKAYWIYCSGNSDYEGPLKISLDVQDGIDFGVLLQEVTLMFKNESDVAMDVSVRDLTTGTSVFSYYQFNADSEAGFSWEPLLNDTVREVGSGIEDQMRLTVRRQDFQTEFLKTLVEIKNGLGTRVLLYGHATKSLPEGDPGIGQVTTQGITERGRAISLMSANPIDIAKSHAGLWVGDATINQVAQSTDPNTLTPAGSDFNLRLMLHVDEEGSTRLLKQVTLMWEEGTLTTDINGDQVVDRPGRYVLITNDSLITQYQGIGLRNGEPVGRRLSAPAFDFPESIASSSTFPLNGHFAEGEALTGTIIVSPNLPTNPFRHKYHPDHDNLDSQFQPISNPALYENFEITRDFSFTLHSAPDPNRPPVTHYGYDTLDGIFVETLSGLHRHAIQVSGTFRLERVSTIAVLNR